MINSTNIKKILIVWPRRIITDEEYSLYTSQPRGYEMVKQLLVVLAYKNAYQSSPCRMILIYRQCTIDILVL